MPTILPSASKGEERKAQARNLTPDHRRIARGGTMETRKKAPSLSEGPRVRFSSVEVVLFFVSCSRHSTHGEWGNANPKPARTVPHCASPQAKSSRIRPSYQPRQTCRPSTCGSHRGRRIAVALWETQDYQAYFYKVDLNCGIFACCCMGGAPSNVRGPCRRRCRRRSSRTTCSSYRRNACRT